MRIFRIISFIAVVSFAIRVEAQSVTVCQSCPVTSLGEAIAWSKDHDTIRVMPGTYLESDILIDKPLTIIGEDHPVIDGQNQGEIIRIIADSVTFNGFHLKHVGSSYTEDFSAIRVAKASHFDIRNNILEDLFFGIYIEKSNTGKIINNQILGTATKEYNSGNGVQLWYSHAVEVEKNYVRGVRDGIYLEFAHDCVIRNNTSANNIRYGLHFMFSNDDLYEYNTFENNGAGVAVMFSKQIKMYHNVFKENWGSASYGLLLKEINDADIAYNTFEENTIGINIEGTNRITYRNNDFVSNGWAMKVRGACYTNRFERNNFLYNSFDVSYNSKINDNKFDNNYWSNYTGYDLDKDGIGDVPFRPVKLFSYIVNRTPETIILLRSMFIDIIDFSEKVSPVFTPDNLLDERPAIKRITW